MCKTKLLFGTLIVVAIIFSNGVFLNNLFQQPLTDKNSTSSPPSGENKVLIVNTITSPEMEKTEPGIDDTTGFIIDSGLEEVRANCMGCHSSLLVTQNRATRDGWLSTIRWMQETQNFWDLGDNETIILDYLARNYSPPEGIGRRANLKNIQWLPLVE